MLLTLLFQDFLNQIHTYCVCSPFTLLKPFESSLEPSTFGQFVSMVSLLKAQHLRQREECLLAGFILWNVAFIESNGDSNVAGEHRPCWMPCLLTGCSIKFISGCHKTPFSFSFSSDLQLVFPEETTLNQVPGCSWIFVFKHPLCEIVWLQHKFKQCAWKGTNTQVIRADKWLRVFCFCATRPSRARWSHGRTRGRLTATAPADPALTPSSPWNTWRRRSALRSSSSASWPTRSSTSKKLYTFSVACRGSRLKSCSKTFWLWKQTLIWS